jgi:Integral membrane protein CcmA involved in cell shape determination
MAIFDQKTAAKKDSAPFTSDLPPFQAPPAATTESTFGATPSANAPRPQSVPAKESLIAADLTIEGKIEGAGNVRIAGKFKGDVNVQGDLTIEPGAKLTGGVRAKRVVIAGEVEGNIEGAAQVELQQGGVLVGDVKAGSLTVASGARMRGQADFGWEEKDKGGKPESYSAS